MSMANLDQVSLSFSGKLCHRRNLVAEEERALSAYSGEKEAVKANVVALLAKIESGEENEVKQAVSELRLLAKWDMNNRVVIGQAGGIPLIASLVSSSDSKVQENAVTALLNLSIFSANREAIIETTSAMDCILEVLVSGATSESKENATALLTSLLIVEEFRDVVGKNSALIGSLSDLLRTGELQGKKDALKALFHLSLWPDNRSRLAMAGIVVQLLALLKSARAGLMEDTLAVLAQIAKCRDGAETMKDSATVSLMIEFLNHGTRLAKELSCSLLLNLCESGGERVASEIRKHRATIVVTLCTMVTVGSPRAKGKANELMKRMVESGSFDLTSLSR